ncbi:MAG: F-type H+-transporting ATPase subunit a [Nitrospirae bacterium]|nr:MAG: F-type H+-transporting ATPase subunit a [Nitrospirota bacterium]
MESPSILGAILPKVPTYVSYSWLAMGVLIGTAVAVKGKLSLVPSGAQNVMEVFADFFKSTSESNIGHHYGEKFYPLLGTIFLYILTCNLFGLIPGFESPTGNINTTASMAIPIFLLYNFYGFKVHGIKYLKHFMGPIQSPAAIPFMIFMFFLEVISHLVRPITLSVRLFGNMMAKHLLLIILGLLAPILIPTIILGLGTLISFIQAYVFMLLTTLYLAGAVEEGH